jgi:hypothetical protein
VKRFAGQFLANDDAGQRGHAAPHCSGRETERSTDKGEKRLIVERFHDKGKDAAFQRIAGVSLPVITITFVSGDTSLSRACTSSLV